MKLSSIIATTLLLTLGINALPESFDWREQGIMTPVKNQLYCHAGYAFASTGVMEAYLKWKRNSNIILSEQDIIDCSYKKFMGGAHNGGCEGGWPTAVFQYFNVKDLVAEQAYPYTSGMSQRHGVCRIPSPINNVVRGRLSVQNIKVRNEDDIRQLLVSKGPLVIAMAADNEWKRFFDDLGDGIFDNDGSVGAQPNHFVVLVGYGSQQGKDYWIIKNSWGSSWAVGGYGKIRRGRNMCGLTTFGVWYVEG
ncbi:hypothetical protein BJ944DRAFT_267803 [Cunninghamella echinulata]|nr:hypothetical protein BJ944DRAFT_267803 [Cunninghamella echinulata]